MTEQTEAAPVEEEPGRWAVLNGDHVLVNVAVATRGTVDSGWLPHDAARVVELDEDTHPQPGARWDPDSGAWTPPDPAEDVPATASAADLAAALAAARAHLEELTARVAALADAPSPPPPAPAGGRADSTDDPILVI